MAETLISPGVLARENDQSFVSKRPVVVGAAIIGPAVKGPVEVPTIVTTWSDYVNKFGTTLESGSVTDKKTYTYFTSIAAYNYFTNGGDSLLVCRAASGTFTSATGSVESSFGGIAATYASASFDITPFHTEVVAVGSSSFSVNGATFTLTGSAGGTNVSPIIYVASGSSATNSAAALVLALNNSSSVSPFSTFLSDISASNSSATFNLIAKTAGASGNSLTFISGSTNGTFGGGANAIAASASFVLETFSEGEIMNSDSTLGTNNILPSGSKDNIRWQVVNSNTSLGTFDLLIRRGDDNSLEPVVVETWTNLSLDPNQSNYVARRIGDIKESYNPAENQIDYVGSFTNRSNYVRVKSVNLTTPNYFDNNGVAKPQYASYLPVNNNGAFGSALGTIAGGANFYNTIDGLNTQGLVGTDYDNMISLLANTDDYKFNVLLTPGLYNTDYTSQITNIISNTQNRGDNIYVIDPVAYGSNVSSVTTEALNRNTSYAAMYWPWVQIVEPSTGEIVWVPASTVIGGVYAYNDSVSEPWFAPAGINRGGLSTVVRAEKKLSQNNRDTLYTGKVNPIATFPGTGVVVYGQKTLQTKASALDRVNVRRLLIALKSYISQIANNLVFEQNTAATRNQFLAQVNPYLTSVQQRQGLYAFKVVMDDSNNTPDVIDRNELYGQIYLQPTKTAEFIYLDFNITPTGASFPA